MEGTVDIEELLDPARIFLDDARLTLYEPLVMALSTFTPTPLPKQSGLPLAFLAGLSENIKGSGDQKKPKRNGRNVRHPLRLFDDKESRRKKHKNFSVPFLAMMEPDRSW